MGFIPDRSTSKLAFAVILTLGLTSKGFADESVAAKAKRATSLYTELSFGRDEYRSQYLSAQIGVEGTRYVDPGAVPGASEDNALFASKKGRGRGGSTSARLSSGVLQSSAWLNWNHNLSDLWSVSTSVQKYFYLGAAPVDGNAAISDRPFVPNQAQLLVDGFPEWTADVGASVWFEAWDLGSRVAFSRARNSTSEVIVAPAINAGWNATEIVTIGGSVSYAIQSSSTLISLNAEWMW